MARQLTRQALFDLIWETPMSRLAPEFEITPQTLAKLCDEVEIPRPDSRYWTLRSMGRPVEKPSLAVESRAADQLITIEAQPPRTPKPAPPIKLKRVAAPKPAAPVDKTEPVAERSERIDTTITASPGPELGSPDRKAQVLALLQAAIEARGWTGKLRKAPYKITVDGEPITLELTENTDRIAHVKTDKENAALRKFEDDRARAQKAGRWFSDWERPNIPEWDYVPNGKLTLKFEAGWHHHGLRRSFADGKRQRLEDLIDATVQTFAAYAQGEKDHRAELEQRRLDAIKAEKRRREWERRKAIDAKRLEFLDLQMGRHDEALRIERFVAAYPDAAREDEKVASFLDWAMGRAARLRAEFAPDRLREKLDRNDLMNDGASEAVSWRPVE